MADGRVIASNKQMLVLLEQWKEETGAVLIDFSAFSKWAVANNYYIRRPISVEKQCENEARRAIRQAHHTNPQGTRVRTYRTFPYAYEGEQLTLEYVDIREAAPDIAQLAFDYDYGRIENDVKRHSIEKQSYDDNNLFAAMLDSYDYNFNDVATDARMSGEYDDSYDDDTDSD